jgi:outer membrane protein
MIKQKIVMSIVCLSMVLLAGNSIYAQRWGFFSSQMVRDKLPDAKLAEQRVQTMVDEWKRELKSMEDKEESLQFDMKKNRLIWSDSEKDRKDKELKDLQDKRVAYAKDKFSPGGEYDKVVKEVMTPVEEKIFGAVQEVASKEKYDGILDQSVQPLAYVNFKYDITLKVLKTLGVDVSLEEKEQEQKIAADPRNDESKKESTAKRSRSRSRKAAEKEDAINAPKVEVTPDKGAPVLEKKTE